MEHWRNDTSRTPVPVPSVHVPMSWNQTQDSTVREAAVNSVEREPINTVRDFLLPDIVLPPSFNSQLGVTRYKQSEKNL
jgi:hypothetical protein